MVHPGVLWAEAETTAVEEDGGFAVLAVSEAADAAVDGHEFAVYAFSHGVGEAPKPRSLGNSDVPDGLEEVDIVTLC